MSYQSQFNSYAAFKAQTALGTVASGAGGTILRQTGGTPGKLSKTPISSKEIRRDAQPVRGRHGMQATTAGPYNCEVSLAAFDDLYEALLRGAWDTEITLTSADFTSITIASNVITFASGDPITLGLRVNDIIEITGASSAANNSRNLRVTAIDATSVTVIPAVAGGAAMTDEGTADSGASIIRRGRKVIMPVAGSLVDTAFTIEEYEYDINKSRLFQDMLIKSAKFAMAPNGIIMVDWDFVGTGAFSLPASPPTLTSPALPSNNPMAVLDATLCMNGVAVADIISFDLTIDKAPVAPAVVASKVSPTVMSGMNSVSMNIKALRKDTSWDADFLNESSLSLSMLAVDQSAEPQNFLSINVPYFTLSSADVSALSSAGGPRDVTIAVPAALVGHDPTGSGYDDAAASIQISNNT